jgi:hypothetical protein
MQLKAQELLYIIAGILGAFIVFFGAVQAPSEPYYSIGAGLMLLTALYFQLTYFIALEIILLAGHGTIFLGLGPMLQIYLPILLCAQLLTYYVLSSQLQNIYYFIGIVGIALLSIGFAYVNQLLFFFGSFAIAIFAMYLICQGKRIAWLWFILNLAFIFISGYKLVFLH